MIIEEAGHYRFKRWRVAAHPGWWWSGEKWVNDARKAMLYPSAESAMEDADQLRRLVQANEVPTMLTIPLRIMCLSMGKVDRLQLLRYLKEKIEIPSDALLDCPLGTITGAWIEWEHPDVQDGS